MKGGSRVLSRNASEKDKEQILKSEHRDLKQNPEIRIRENKKNA
jgi:hypothetical protein